MLLCVRAEYRKRESKKGQHIVHIIFVCLLLVERCSESVAFVVCVACVCYPFLLGSADCSEFSQSSKPQKCLKAFFHLPLCCYHRQCSFFAQVFVFTRAFCAYFYCIIIIPFLEDGSSAAGNS